MEKSEIQIDGSFAYDFNKEDLKEMILEKHPELIDDNHKFDSIYFAGNHISLMIVRNCCGKLIYKDDTIKCGDWSGGDKHFCNKCLQATQGVKK